MRKVLVPTAIFVLVGGAALLVGCGSSDQKGLTPAATETQAQTATEASAGPVASSECSPGPTKGKGVPAPTKLLDAKKQYTATLQTSRGPIKFSLDAKQSPKTASSFAYLANRKFYDGLLFTRVAKDFVIQGGDPLNSGREEHPNMNLFHRIEQRREQKNALNDEGRGRQIPLIPRAGR